MKRKPRPQIDDAPAPDLSGFALLDDLTFFALDRSTPNWGVEAQNRRCFEVQHTGSFPMAGEGGAE